MIVADQASGTMSLLIDRAFLIELGLYPSDRAAGVRLGSRKQARVADNLC
jgi:hypothetical protein